MDSNKKKLEIYGLDEGSLRVMSFGKYKGATVLDVMSKDPQYLLWAHDNVQFFKLSELEETVADELSQQKRMDEIENAELSGYGYDEFWKEY